MKKLHASIFIHAPREKVWNTMLGKDSYPKWTKVFNPTSRIEAISRFEGDWSEGSKILFLGTDEDSREGGMVSRIAKNRPHEYISIEHLGIMENGVEDTTSEKAKKWTPAFENYSFTEKDGGTQLTVDMDVADEYKNTFEDMWPKALEVLKKLVERS